MRSAFFYYTKAQRTAIVILSILIGALLLYKYIGQSGQQQPVATSTTDKERIREIEQFMSTVKEEPLKKKKVQVIEPVADPFEQAVDRIDK